MKKIYYHPRKPPKKNKKRQYKEHNHQVAIFDMAKLYERQYPILALLQGSLTGVNLDIKVATRAKRAGVKAGFPDINLPITRGNYLGLYVELKTDKGKLSSDQRRIMTMLTNQGHLVLMLKGHADPFNVIIQYIEGKISRPTKPPPAPKEKAPDETKTEAQLHLDGSSKPLQAPAGKNGGGQEAEI